MSEMNKQGQHSLSETDRQYRRWLSRYFGMHLFGSAAKSIREINALIANNILPSDPQNVYDLGRFLYLEMKEDNFSEEWLAIQLFDQSADAGMEEAQTMLATILKEHRRTANKGSLNSQSLLWHYTMMKYPNDAEVQHWLCRAADQSDSESEYFLSICYLSGLCGILQDERKAVQYTQRAVEHGYSMAAYNLGCFYANGTHCTQSTDLARYYWRIALDAGHPDAQRALDELLSGETASPKPEDNLTAKMMSLLSDIQKSVKDYQSEIIKTTKSEGEKIRDDINHQHTLTRNAVHTESERLSDAIAAIEDSIIRQTFNGLNEAIDTYRTSLVKFEALQQMMASIGGDVSAISQSVRKSEDLLAAIQDVAGMTADQLDDLASQMQQFYERMDAQSVQQIQDTALSDLRSMYESELAKLFGDCWINKQLLDTTKESLIAARVLLVCAEREGICDCRGIVISATSALERELKARFYTGIRSYFKETGIWDGSTETELPPNLQQKLKAAEDKFTLGDVKYILSCEDFLTKLPRQGYTSEQIPFLRSYLKEHIISDDILSGIRKQGGRPYNPERPEDLFTFNGKPCFTDKLIHITNNYRNPAAHTSDTPREVARQCCLDVIGQSKTDLANIEGLLLELLKLTDRFHHD